MPVDVDLLDQIRAAQAQQRLPKDPASPYGARRSRAHQPSMTEAQLEASAPPFAALPGGRETAGCQATRPSSGRRLSDGAFTRAAAIAPLVVALAVSAIALANSALSADPTLAQVLRTVLIAAAAGGAVAVARIPVGRYLVHTRVAVLGPPVSAYALDRKLAGARGQRYSVIGHVALPGPAGKLRSPPGKLPGPPGKLRGPPEKRPTTIGSGPVSFRVRPLGELDELDAIVEQNHIDLIVLAQKAEDTEVTERAADCASRLNKRLTSLDNFERPTTYYGISAKRFKEILTRLR